MRRRTPRPRAETMQATRTALIDAAMEEFSRHGLDASLDRICATAGLTRGAFYVHFADRDALITAVMEHVLGGLVAQLTGAPLAPGAGARAVDLFFAAARARAPAVHGGRALRFHHLLDACHRSRAVGDSYRALLAGARDRLAASLAVDHAQPVALADLLVVAALGTVAALELDLPLDLGRLAATARGLVKA